MVTLVNMCLAIPGKVKEIQGQKITVQYPSETREVLAGGEDLKVGDYVMVQMGIVVTIITPKEAEVSLKAWTNN